MGEARILFGLTVLGCLVNPAFHGPRDLDVVELFAGVAAITRAARNAGYQAEAYDKNRVLGQTDDDTDSKCEDITTEKGFLRAVSLVMRIKMAGLLFMAPVCGSWVYLNISRTKRALENQWYGDVMYEPVRQGNAMAMACAFLAELAKKRRVQVVAENPPGSSLWKFRPWARAMQSAGMTSEAICDRCAYQGRVKKGGPWRIGKKYKMVATGDWIRKAERKCSCPGKKHIVPY